MDKNKLPHLITHAHSLLKNYTWTSNMSRSLTESKIKIKILQIINFDIKKDKEK